jgi:hypothetical protein
MLLGYPPGGIEKFIPNRHHRHEQRRSFGRSRPPPAALTRRPSDKTGEDIIPFTQEFLSKMLGVRRGTVSAVATRFEAAGLIHTGRGQIQILDRKGLKKEACSCYEFVTRHVDRLLANLPRLAQNGQSVRR